jgi:hypothetical protein
VNARLLSLLACAGRSTPAGGGVQAQVSDEPALVELQLARLASRTVSAVRRGNDILIPLSEFYDLAEIQYSFPRLGSIEARLQPGDLRLFIDSQRDTVLFGKREIPLPAGSIFSREGEVYLSSAMIGYLFSVRFIIDWVDLNVAVADPDRLPLGRRIAREAARSSLSAMETGVRPDLALTLDRRHWNGLVLDYSFLSPSESMLEGGSFATAMGMDLFGGSMEMGLASTSTIGEGDLRADISWTGVWRQQSWLRQLRIGDGLSTGPRPRTVRGFAVSNAPFQRPALLGEVPYAGHLGPGWEIEAYRGGRLVAFDSADGLGQFSIDVPVQYGENPVDFIAYGPFGEVREFNQTYRIVGEVLPREQFEYGVAAGQCRVADCTANANVDIRYGLSRRWTVQTGVDQFWRDSLPNLFHPYAALAGNLGNSWAVQLEGVAGAVLRSGLSYEPSTDLHLATEFTSFATGTEAPILTPQGRLRQWTTTAFLRPIPRAASFYLDGSIDRIESQGGSSNGARMAVSFQTQEIRFLPSIRVQHDIIQGNSGITRSFLGLNTFILPRDNLGAFLSKVTARTSFETEGNGRAVSASAFFSRPLGESFRVETGLAWMRGTGTMFSLVLSTSLNKVRAFSTVTSGSTGTQAVNFVQGSLLYTPSRRQMDLSSGPAVQRSGVSGYVFLDANGNGRRDAGEEPLRDARVRVGNLFSFSDSLGRYRVWDLLPFEPVLVVLDASTLESPLWVPSYTAISVEPGPNQFRSLDIPVVPGGVVEGRVIRETTTGPLGIGGVTIYITERKTGNRVSTVTFSDGAFYTLGLKPGDYEITVAEAVEQRLLVTSEAIRFTMPSSRDGETVADLELVLKPQPGGSR